jgi:hypothetical protein
VTVEAAGEVYARLVTATSRKRQDHPVVRTLARLADELGYLDGSSTTLSTRRVAALPALDLPRGLVDALMG